MSGALAIVAFGILWLGAATALLGALGLLFMSDPFARLHAASLIGIVAPLGAAIAAGIAFAELGATIAILAFLAVSLATTGIGTHATARALHLRRTIEERIGEERLVNEREARE